jgi:phosphoheptose isomerase
MNRHLTELCRVLQASDAASHTAHTWGHRLVAVFDRGGKLLVGGNGGSAAEAQHLTAELVGRFVEERRPLPAIALHSETSSVTAIANDFGYDTVYARQISAFAGRRDVVLLLSTSGKSQNLLEAVAAARDSGATVWAMTGPRPNPLADLAEDVIAVDSDDSCVVQEVHLVVVHLVAAAVDAALRAADYGSEAVPA